MLAIRISILFGISDFEFRVGPNGERPITGALRVF